MTIFSCFSLESFPCFDSLNTFFPSLNFLVKFCLTFVLKISFSFFSSWKNQHLFPLLHPFIQWISLGFSSLLVLLSSCFTFKTSLKSETVCVEAVITLTFSSLEFSALVLVSGSCCALVTRTFDNFSSSTYLDSSSAFCFWVVIKSSRAFSFSSRHSFSFWSASFVTVRSTFTFFIKSSFSLTWLSK